MISANHSDSSSGIHAASTALPSVGIELTPLLDVVFIVIVFLLLTANAPLLSLPVDVPAGDRLLPAHGEQQSINISIVKDKAGWFIDESAFLAWDAFVSRFGQVYTEKPEAKINIAADHDADVQRFVKVMIYLNQQGIGNTHIILKEK